MFTHLTIPLLLTKPHTTYLSVQLSISRTIFSSTFIALLLPSLICVYFYLHLAINLLPTKPYTTYLSIHLSIYPTTFSHISTIPLMNLCTLLYRHLPIYSIQNDISFTFLSTCQSPQQPFHLPLPVPLLLPLLICEAETTTDIKRFAISRKVTGMLK